MPRTGRVLTAGRRAFYNLDGPWLRCRLFEALGSRRYSWPALNELDRRLQPLLPDRPGTFLEAGAHDGYTQSNTYYLERFRGWRGVLVEAVPELATKAVKRRAQSRVVQAALVGPEREGEEVVIHFGDLTSTLGDRGLTERGLHNAGREPYDVRVPGRTISSILDEAGLSSLDLLLLDIEGQELEALRGLDLERHGPALMVIEMLDMATQRPAFDELLASHYEFVCALSADDAAYRRLGSDLLQKGHGASSRSVP
jgi:FkbM family methyltransferase